jgi:Flp pilus assembly protein TadD
MLRIPVLLAATALALTGCQSGGIFRAAPKTAAAVPVPGMLSAQAEAALAGGQPQAAVTFAELAVRADSANVSPRLLLARGYMATGRVAAAAESYGDVLDIDAGHAKARLGRALMRLAAGDRTGAVADLDALPQAVSRADVGLGYALAGDSARGVELLLTAARQPNADARVRQNLALALALDGQWERARTVASQDLDAVAVDARMRDWAALAAETVPARRTAQLLALVPVAGDPGRPVELAYVQRAAPVEVAAREPAAPEREPEPKPEPEPEPEPEPVRVAETPPPAPVVTSVALAETPARGNWVVQVGAYRDAARRDAYWQQLTTHYARIVALQPVRDSVGGLNRLAVGGLDRSAALALCEEMKRDGNACFLRADAPVMLAARTN